MRHLNRGLLFAAATLCVTIPAVADDDDWRRRGSRRGEIAVVERALDDLDRLRSYRFVDNHDRRHVEQARRDLIRFRENWARGRFDKDRLDGAIENIHHLADADRVHPRERQMLRRDMEALRAFRARGGYSYRR